MIKDQERAAEILQSFPQLSNEIIDEIELEIMPQYLFYSKQGKKTADCFCTHCRERFENSQIKFKHNEIVTCPTCGCLVQL